MDGKTILKDLPPKQGQIRLGAAVEIGYFAQVHDSLNIQHSVLDELLLVHHNMIIKIAKCYAVLVSGRAGSDEKRRDSSF